MKIIVIIPARGGSKGIPKKNISLLNSKPLISYTIETALKANITKHVYVSTDSDEIGEISRNYGAQIIKRPKEISNDAASTESALIHAIDIIKKEEGWIPDAILTLPATSPLRKGQTIKNFISYYQDVADHYDAMISLTKTNGDYWIKSNDGKFRRLFPHAPRRRQDRNPIYLENSAIYITKTEALLKTNSILGNNCTCFVIDALEAIDINDPIDILWAEFIMKNGLV